MQRKALNVLLDRIEALALKCARLEESNEAYVERIASRDRVAVEAENIRKQLERELADSRSRVDAVLSISENLRAAIGQPLIEVEWVGGFNLPKDQWSTFPRVTFIKFIREYNILPSREKMGLKEAKDLTETGGKLRLPITMMADYQALIAPRG